ncbi:dephospho-CoA kinase, partial [Mycoplasmopsis pullorum]
MIAVVGKVASGKSTFLKHLQELGYKTFICDDYVNWLYRNDEQVKLNFINFFGQGVVQNGQINKSFLKEQIKLNPQNLKFIEKVIFPIIFEHLKTHLYDFVEIPVLFTEIVDFSKLFSAI